MSLRKKDTLGPARCMAKYINAVVLAATASPEGQCFEIALTEREYDELTRALAEDIETDYIIYGAIYTGNAVILRADALDFRSFADCLAYDAKHAENSRHQRILNQVLYRVRELLGKWSSG